MNQILSNPTQPNEHLIVDEYLRGIEVYPNPRLQEALKWNVHLIPKFRENIRYAVQLSFSHKDTRMRQITRKEVLARIQLCLALIEEAHYEMHYGLRKILDVLPAALINLIRTGCSAEVVGEGRQEESWYVHAPPTELKPVTDDAGAGAEAN